MEDSYLSVLPPELVRAVRALPERRSLQEIRLRSGHRARYLAGGAERVLGEYRVDTVCLKTIVNRATGYSAYASGAQLRQGFLTLPGGHRLGLCGQGVMGAEGVHTLKDISSVNLRIARQVALRASQAARYVRSFPGSTLIAGPPGCGKTTLLRELIRAVSVEERVGIVDERLELAACHGGTPGFDVGPLTDVLSGVPKHEGVYMLLRTMNPDWIAVDEITEDRDVDALLRSSFCGVRILASAHVFCREDLRSRPLYARMCALGLFENLILMDKHHGTKMERMVTNDQTPGRCADRRVSGLRGTENGAERAV